MLHHDSLILVRRAQQKCVSYTGLCPKSYKLQSKKNIELNRHIYIYTRNPTVKRLTLDGCEIPIISWEMVHIPLFIGLKNHPFGGAGFRNHPQGTTVPALGFPAMLHWKHSWFQPAPTFARHRSLIFGTVKHNNSIGWYIYIYTQYSQHIKAIYLTICVCDQFLSGFKLSSLQMSSAIAASSILCPSKTGRKRNAKP